MEDGKFDWNSIYTGDDSDYEAPDEAVVRIIETLPPGKALDVGCGAGGLLAGMATLGWEVSGVDIAEKGIAAARRTLQRFGHEGNLYVADASKWQPPNAPYDLIVSTFALPGTREEQQQAFAMMKASLAPGGTVVVKDFDEGMKWVPEFSGYHMPTVSELKEAFTGLEVCRAEVVETPTHRHAKEDQVSKPWTAVLFQARREKK